MVTCFSRHDRKAKAELSGLHGPLKEYSPVDFVIRIWLDRVKPHIKRLRQESYHLNLGVSDIMPPDVVKSSATSPLPSKPDVPIQVPTFKASNDPAPALNTVTIDKADAGSGFSSSTDFHSSANANSDRVAGAAVTDTTTADTASRDGATNDNHKGVDRMDVEHTPAIAATDKDEATDAADNRSTDTGVPVTRSSAAVRDSNIKIADGSDQDIQMATRDSEYDTTDPEYDTTDSEYEPTDSEYENPNTGTNTAARQIEKWVQLIETATDGDSDVGAPPSKRRKLVDVETGCKNKMEDERPVVFLMDIVTGSLRV
ncbi:hypothetical protein F4808DRAFT_78101 [Astrocystis sublimbata]|nr:hypothetical protein F4808DRAFT_78101 [Astrocystis sublimbata]